MKKTLFRIKPLLAILLALSTSGILYILSTVFGWGFVRFIAPIFALPYYLGMLSQYPIVVSFVSYIIPAIIWYLLLSIIFCLFNKKDDPAHIKNIRWQDFVFMAVLALIWGYINLIILSPTTMGSKSTVNLTSPLTSKTNKIEEYNQYYKTNFCPLNNKQGDNFCQPLDESADGQSAKIPSGKLLILQLNKNVYDQSTIKISATDILTPNDFHPKMIIIAGKDQVTNYWSQSYMIVKEGEVNITVQRFDKTKPFTTHLTVDDKWK